MQRFHHSDTDLIPDVHKTATQRAAGARPLLGTQSEPAISQRRPHPLLDDGDSEPHSSSELLLAAETLENIAAEGIYMGATMRRLKMGYSEMDGEKHTGREMNDRILRLVYGTMKCITPFPRHDTYLSYIFSREKYRPPLY
jgi:hypothetical protein